jgi:FkbM family methyltransferase
MRAAAYLVSTPGERAAGRLAADEQLREIERLVADLGWELVAVFDESEAEGAGRAQLRAALERADEFDKLVVVRLDRFGRGVRALERIVADFETAGADVVSVEEQLDTGTEAGAAARRMLALLAGWQPRGREGGGSAAPAGLRAHDLSPATVIDVGAGHGTELLLEGFPDAYHVLIEPLEEFAPELERVLARHRGERIAAAIGDERGRVTINVDPTLYMSSIRTPGRPRPSEARDVPLDTLDDLQAERGWTAPFGLKIDTEGYEREVVKGARRLLAQCQFVMAEVSVAPRFEGDCSAAEFIALMRDAGLDLVDVLDAARGLGGSYADLLFKRASG